MPFSLRFIILALLLTNCVALPPAPKTRICLVNAKKNVMRCINYKQTKYTVPIAKADKYVCTPGKDYLELNAYLNKMADVFKREVLQKVGE